MPRGVTLKNNFSMIRVTDILTALRPLIGWQQCDTGDAVIADSLTVSESGLFYQQAHPLLTLSTLKSISPQYTSISYDLYSSIKQYTRGEIVNHNNTLYRALVNVVGITPGTDVTKWETFSNFSGWLQNKTDAAIVNMVNKFITTKILESNSKSILLNSPLYSYSTLHKRAIVNTESYVGYELRPALSKGVSVKLEKIALFFSQEFDLDIYIFNSASDTFVHKITTRTEKDKVKWVNLQDVYVNSNDNNLASGTWYVCYKQIDLPETAVAYNSSYDFSSNVCSYCSKQDAVSVNTRKKYLTVQPFKSELEPIPDFSSAILYTDSNTYGLNLEVSILCDFTNFIVEQKHMFTDLLLKSMAVQMLREIAFNSNAKINRLATNAIITSKQEILYELDGDSTSLKKSGLVYEFNNAIKAVDLNTRGIDSVCLPCKSKGLKYKTIG